MSLKINLHSHFNDTKQYTPKHFTVTYLHNGRDHRVSNLPDTDQVVPNDTDAIDNKNPTKPVGLVQSGPHHHVIEN
jgi:hypothetical protein